MWTTGVQGFDTLPPTQQQSSTESDIWQKGPMAIHGRCRSARIARRSEWRRRNTVTRRSYEIFMRHDLSRTINMDIKTLPKAAQLVSVSIISIRYCLKYRWTFAHDVRFLEIFQRFCRDCVEIPVFFLLMKSQERAFVLKQIESLKAEEVEQQHLGGSFFNGWLVAKIIGIPWGYWWYWSFLWRILS